MDEHHRVVQECVTQLSSVNNSKVLSKDKYDQIVSQLSNSASTSNLNPKFRWWIKEKGYQLFNFPEIGLTDVLCVPPKKQVIKFPSFNKK